MRIIGGKYKGRVIGLSHKFKARPTTDFARESLFNILANVVDFNDVKVLDLFGGSGSISFEFASRGCMSIDVVDLDAYSLKAITETARKLEITGMRTIRADVFRYIASCSNTYNIVFADPPYDLKELATLPELILGSLILEKNGRFILEHPKGFNFSDNAYFTEHRKYGNVHFSFFRL
ncbi:MAG: RsmD family RNA methyltransferase [Bacteroidales bacterium]|nr:RsmD family RNA methyltransferase [Bacteroidales bacterium]